MINTITLIGLVQAIFGILIFVSKRPNHISFKIIVFWLILISLSLTSKLLPFETIEYFRFGTFPILFLHGPLLYLYVSSLVNEDFKLTWKEGLHAIPVFIIGLHRSLGNQVSINSSSDLTQNPNYIYNNIYFALLIISLIIYWILSIQMIILHRKSIPYFFSNYTEKNTLNWLILLIILFLILFVAELFISYIEKLSNTQFSEFVNIHINLTIFTFMLVFFGIKQNAIYKTSRVGSKNLYFSENEETTDSENIHPVLNKKQEEKITNEIILHLTSKKPYMNPDYSLQMMADELHIPRYKLSQVINSNQKKNFFKFINEFRVEEVKRKLKNPAYKHYTVLGVALECGFNSKTSFNRIFKEETGVTPSEFKKSISNGN